MSRWTPREPREAHEPRADSGFTLIEVVVTLALVAVLLAAIGKVVAVAVQGTRALEQRVALTETAHLIATDVLSRERIGNLSGETLGYRWQVRAEPLAADAASPFVAYHLVLRVSSPSGSALSLETVRLRRKPQ